VCVWAHFSIFCIRQCLGGSLAEEYDSKRDEEGGVPLRLVRDRIRQAARELASSSSSSAAASALQTPAAPEAAAAGSADGGASA
jgi:hypothetical protein